MTYERIYRWEVALIAVLVLAGVGVYYERAIAVIAALIPLTYVLFGSVNSLPDSPDIDIEREVSKTQPAPGEHVQVRLCIQNIDSVVYSDVRIVDEVPDELTVIDGSPRIACSLRPGSDALLEYTMIAKRGSHDFQAPIVRLRTLSGTQRQTFRIQEDGETSVECRVTSGDVPLHVAQKLRAGGITADTPGEGLDFHSLREYRVGDKLSRVDWRNFAKRKELTTVEFREEHPGKILLVIDARSVVHSTPFVGHPSGVELVTYVASQVATALFGAGHQVGATVIGMSGEDIDSPVRTDTDDTPWIVPGSNNQVQQKIRTVLNATQESYSSATVQSPQPTGSDEAVEQRSVPDGGSSLGERLQQKISSGTQIMLISPLIDNTLLPVVESFQITDHSVSCISPNITIGQTKGVRVAALERQVRLDTLRATGTPVVDWQPADPLWAVLENDLEKLL